LKNVIKASGNEIEPYWPLLFAKALKSANINELLTNIASAPAAGPVTAGGPAEVVEAPKEEEKKEEVEDVDMGGLFGDDDEY